MSNKKIIRIRGFTLIEMLLVMVIVSALIFMGVRYLQQKTLNTRIDRTITQMQQILNASLAFYVANGHWPSAVQELQDAKYLPSKPSPYMAPWGRQYYIDTNGTGTSPIYVYTYIKTAGNDTSFVANTIAGSLPLGYTSTSGDSPPASGTCAPGSTLCGVVGMANIPGQDLNNASAVNFGSVYHNGACVPAPQCPVGTNGNPMTPEILVAPVSLSGVNDPNNPTSVYPISSFTAYVTTSSPVPAPDPCPGSTSTACEKTVGTAENYWRVCMEVITEKGKVNWDGWGKSATAMAITRCSISGEPSGSDFSVFAP